MKQYIKRHETTTVMKRIEMRMAIYILLLLVGTTLAVVTYISHHYSSPVMKFLASQHIPLMLLMIFISIGFGHTWANTLQQKLQQEKRDTQQILSVLKDLLNKDEQLVIRMLIENNGMISQNELAKRQSMTRVKAHRVVKALEERGVVHTEKIGKRVSVHLDKPILEKLQ